jgi:hypothetical protein
MQCSNCSDVDLVEGAHAEEFKESNLIQVSIKNSGWTYLMKCKVCDTYWQLTWENPKGHDPGMTTLKKLSDETLKIEWPDL